MRRITSLLILCILLAATLPVSAVAPPAPIGPPVGALTPDDANDAWWDEGWPYRIPVSASGAGVAEVSIDFGAAFDALGLNKAVLDIRSLRVVPYQGTTPDDPLPYAETYSTMLEDADAPQIGWHSSGVYWDVNDGSAVADSTRYSQGSGSLKAVVENLPDGYGYPGVELKIASGDPLSDWQAYEAFIYDVWPEVNASAVDQSPDLYWYKLYSACNGSSITQGGPPLALDQWNRASVSLDPLDTCTMPTLSSITRMEFHTRDNDTVNGNAGLWDDGDLLTLWFDNVRLVDQNSGAIRWQTDGSATGYYIYFDTLTHEGHPAPTLADPGAATVSGVAGDAEAGGIFHLLSGAQTGSLQVWAAPPVEKIGRDYVVPVATDSLRIQAARDEFEPFQLVVRSPSVQSLPLAISDFVHVHGAGVISSSQVSLRRVDYITLTRRSDHFGRLGAWPDPLYPLVPGANVDLPAGKNQPLWFTVHVPRTALPGLYTATVTLGSAALPVELQVWNFALPREIHLAGEWKFGWSQVVEDYGGTSGGSVHECYWDVVDAFREHFSDRRLTPSGVAWPAGLFPPGGVEYDCDGGLDPDAWGIWDFHTLAQKYLEGNALDRGAGFPSFQIKGPSSNWPPASRPSSFCGESRGTDPPGNSAYNDEWFLYWSAVSDYLSAQAAPGVNPEYAERGYYHIVNEPQTFADYDIVAYLSQETKAHAPHVRILVSEGVEPAIYANETYTQAKIDIWMPTITSYQVAQSHDRQQNHGESVFWYFLHGDQPPLPNPTIIDRPGIEARITPWLAWRERVEGLFYYSLTDWSPDPWENPWINDCNGDGFLMYPPRGGVVATDPCSPESNRLVTSIRWELLREGMEDYEYLWLLNGGQPVIDLPNAADAATDSFIASRTLFSRVASDLYAARAAIAEQLSAPTVDKTVSPPAVAVGDALTYTLTYATSDLTHTVLITDDVPAATTLLTVTASSLPAPTVAGQTVEWTASVPAQGALTLTIVAQATATGTLTNTALFSGTHQRQASAGLLIYARRIYLPLLLRD